MSAIDLKDIFSSDEFANILNAAVFNSAPIQRLLTEVHVQSKRIEDLQQEVSHLRDVAIPQLQSDMDAALSDLREKG